MRSLPKPADDAGDVFKLCVSSVSDAALKKRLLRATQAIRDAAAKYDEHAASSTLYLMPTSDVVAGVSRDEMEPVYSYRMVHPGQPGRVVYDRLQAAPAFGECPLCAQRVVTTLDHHLPQSKFPALVVAPANLVPSCADCNKAKLAHQPTTAADQLHHPYYDDVGDSRWLTAKVERLDAPVVQFYAQPDPRWPAARRRSVENTFAILKLGALYASHASRELVNIRSQLKKLFARAGASGVREYLLETEESRRLANANSWQTALFEALSHDEWFCTTGFAMIGA